MADFMTLMKKSMDTSIFKKTENGALGYASSGHALLDLNFMVSSLRNCTEDEICGYFLNAFAEDANLAMKWLFYARDVRGGLGERRTFRAIYSKLPREIGVQFLKYIPEYGRYDDLIELVKCPQYKNDVIDLISNQLAEDIKNMRSGNGISLCAKWMPSINTSSAETRALAHKIANSLRLSAKQYRKLLSRLRKYINVVETKMSANDWASIAYQTVPSRANLKYRNAFKRHDEERFLEFLANKGDKLKSANLLPYEMYRAASWDDEVNEQLWKNYPRFPTNNTLVVADGSGSMTWEWINGSGATPLDVANSLAIYFAENAQGPYANKYITFSYRPQYVDLGEKTTLYEKKRIALQHSECSNTNIEAVFDLILDTAVKNSLKQEELPEKIVILSDMEFDEGRSKDLTTEVLFDTIQRKYNFYGYKMPKLVFWNICGRSNAIPMQSNENGLVLMSGFTPNQMNMLMSNKLDPYENLVEVLNGDRYKNIELL